MNSQWDLGRKVIVFVRKASLVKHLQCIARRLVAPQPMGRAVRWQRLKVEAN